MSWKDRLKPTIEFLSPEFNHFEALWAGNARSMEKKLGIFEFPKIQGLKIQDLDVGGVRYPLTIFFEGDDHDQEADRFFKACKERGLWSIVHPFLGELSLQLISISEEIQPVTSGNITQINTEWLEPKETEISISLPQIAVLIDDRGILANLSAIAQFVDNVVQTTANFAKKIQTETDKLTAVITSGLQTLTAPIASINSSIASIQRSIQNTITQTTIDILSLGGQIQQLVQLPVLASTDIQQRLSIYSGMIANVFELLPSGNDPEDKNTVSIHEVALAASVVAIAQISSSGVLATRSQAVETIETNSQLFTDITDNLDASQEAFQTTTIDRQYFSQSSSFADSAKITALAIQYLQQASFDLAIERKIILEAPRAPIEITITEYGDLGDNDANFDLFLESNKLKNNDILLLPAGREVMVYV